MELMKGLYSGIRDWYGTLNPATLSGAIDVIVVQQPDGSLACSPFHVRFGKMGVLRSTEKLVDIEINGQPVENLYMKLGDNGEAFFVESTEEEETLPANLATSPLPSEMSIMEEGIRRLHAGELLREKQNQKNVEELLDDKNDNSSKRSQEDVDRVLKCIKEPCTEEDMKELQKLGGPVEVTVETEVGKGKNKRQLKLTGSLKGVEDTDSQSSLDENKDSRFRTQVSDDSVKSPRQSGRTKIRRKRKRQLKGTAASLTGVDSKHTWRQASLSDSNGSVSSSDELDSEGLFPMDEDFNVPRVPAVWNYGQSDHLTDELINEDWSSLPLRSSERIFHVFSEGDVTPLLSPEGTRPPTPKSDTELETNRPYHCSLKKGSISDNEKIEWNWGELPECTVPAEESPVLPEVIESSPTSKKIQPTIEPPSNDSSKPENEKDKKWLWQRLSFRRGPPSGDTQEGMYLDDLASEGIDPEVYALYFPERRLRTISQDIKDEDKSSDLGASLPHSPNTVESGCESPPSMDDLRFCDIQMSLCGGLKVEDNEVPMDKFNQHIISFEKFSSDPIILSNPNLVVRIGSKFYTWQVAGPILMSLLAFQRPLPDNTVSSLVKDNTKGEGRRSFTDWLWPRNYTKTESTQPVKEEEAADGDEEKSGETSKVDVVLEMDGTEKTETTDSKDQTSVDGTEGSSTEKQDTQEEQPVHLERFKKTIRLSSDELKKLNLKPGANNVCFSVTTRYQGTAMCQATIYLWRHDSKIVISDVDGTITRSDVFGQILPVIGKDWTHSGVANLFDGVRKNGYEFIYLSARAIGQSKTTKAYLKSVCQDSLSLPDGPLLLNPSSLLRALHREVIIKKPEEFKIRCLKDIQSLFSEQGGKGSPFYAGFGNRINDTWAYHAVGIPSSRIFTINPQGKVTHEFTKSFQTSYPHLRNLTDQLFPPIDRRDRVTLVEPDQYSHFTYWRQPLPSIDVSSLQPKEEKKS